MSRLVMEDNGRWDVNAAISPALAAALEAAPARSDDEADASIQQLHDALAALEKGKSEFLHLLCLCQHEWQQQQGAHSWRWASMSGSGGTSGR